MGIRKEGKMQKEARVKYMTQVEPELQMALGHPLGVHSFQETMSMQCLVCMAKSCNNPHSYSSTQCAAYTALHIITKSCIIQRYVLWHILPLQNKP